jgi:hypothetical protein
MHVINHAGLSEEQLAAIGQEIEGQRRLDDILNWAVLSDPAAFIQGIVEDVVAQDEFTNDVIVPWRDTLVLVYDST